MNSRHRVRFYLFLRSQDLVTIKENTITYLNHHAEKQNSKHKSVPKTVTFEKILKNDVPIFLEL